MKCYEVFLKDPNVSKEEWDYFLFKVAKIIGIFKKFKIYVNIDKHKIRYFLFTKERIPNCFNSEKFLIKENYEEINLKGTFRGFATQTLGFSFLELVNRFYKKNKDIKGFLISFRFLGNKFRKRAFTFYNYNEKEYYKRIFLGDYASFLGVDFELNPSYFYEKVPKYLKLDKVVHLLQNNSNNSLFKIDGFPYFDDNLYLNIDAYDYDKHSFVIGASGSGKSKFLASFITKICNSDKDKKIVVIDPHDSLKNDLYPILKQEVIDFKDNSVNLFLNPLDDVNASLELTLSLFKTFINDGYNSKLERVLRFCCYLLLFKNELSFLNLRKLILDMDYRNSLIDELKMNIPSSVSFFFLTEFNELKNGSYSEAFAPIISFLDEMQMIPIFNENITNRTILDVIENNRLTLFSLNRINLGDMVTKTIAGFIMQQIFLIAQTNIVKEDLIVIIDEVAVLENPILTRFLAEMRKFGVFVILAGQYFHQISSDLKEAILANTSNYYLFRVSKQDASLLEKNLPFKLEIDDSTENREKFLMDLKDRECVIRVSKNGVLYPMIKGMTTDFLVPPLPKIEKKEIKKEQKEEELFDFNFDIRDANVKDIMKKNSSSRKKVV